MTKKERIVKATETVCIIRIYSLPDGLGTITTDLEESDGQQPVLLLRGRVYGPCDTLPDPLDHSLDAPREPAFEAVRRAACNKNLGTIRFHPLIWAFIDLGEQMEN